MLDPVLLNDDSKERGELRDRAVEEVAEIIQVPKNTVKTRMFYARQSMEKLLTASGYGLH